MNILSQRFVAGFVGVLFFLLLFTLRLSADELTDQEKKEIVYRMYADYKKEFPNVKDISPQKAMHLHGQGKIVFVDTRELQQMRISH